MSASLRSRCFAVYVVLLGSRAERKGLTGLLGESTRDELARAEAARPSGTLLRDPADRDGAVHELRADRCSWRTGRRPRARSRTCRGAASTTVTPMPRSRATVRRRSASACTAAA